MNKDLVYYANKVSLLHNTLTALLEEMYQSHPLLKPKKTNGKKLNGNGASIDGFAFNAKVAGLTTRQCQIIKLICQQKTSKEIAPELGLSSRTIEEERCAIQKKINTKSVVGIVLYAIKNQLVDLKRL